MKVAKIQALDKAVRFRKEWDGEEFWFDVKEKSMTPAAVHSFLAIEKDVYEMAKGLAAVLTNWSLWLGEPPKDWEDPEPGELRFSDFPPTVENIASLPFDFLSEMIETISETWQGNGQTPTKSRSSSSANR